MMAKKLVMSFLTEQGTTSSMTLEAPRDDLTEEDVREVMELIITENVFSTAKGDLVDIKKAEVITTTQEVLIAEE
ncbi:MAG TPA: DUF2922 domain-containing protein [Sedimentibacter sp.]|jgi:hypothetical protein|nr:DUF2922 domain-containing protein [Sedimentibacter sp.]HHZ00887.1 DUF2922 domain-containing protein [Tissierellia bacterium]HOW23479.1 DUF2922 domain-containing protein [Sedimentibacter sp.]